MRLLFAFNSFRSSSAWSHMWSSLALGDVVIMISWITESSLCPFFSHLSCLLFPSGLFPPWKMSEAIVSILIDKERFADRCLNYLFQRLSCACGSQLKWLHAIHAADTRTPAASGNATLGSFFTMPSMFIVLHLMQMYREYTCLCFGDIYIYVHLFRYVD